MLQNGQGRQSTRGGSGGGAAYGGGGGGGGGGGRKMIPAAPSTAEASDLFSTTCLTTVDECEAFSHALANNVVMERVVLSGSTLSVPGALSLSRVRSPFPFCCWRSVPFMGVHIISL